MERFLKVKPLLLNTEDPNINQTIQNFSASSFTTNDIDERSIYVKAGKGPNALAEIDKEVNWKFPSYSFPPLQI